MFRLTAGMVYEMTHLSCYMLVLLVIAWINKGGMKASLRYYNITEALCEKG